MTAMTTYPPGTFCWADLATTDGPGARTFYTGLFGWNAVDAPGDGGFYTMLEQAGNPVAAMYAMEPEQVAEGVPPHWQSYVSVASADESAERAAALGGTVLLAPFDVETVGRMAVVRDPTGAVFSLWQPRTHPGAALVNEPGSLCWNELYTNDPEAAAGFYQGLFGWSAHPVTTAGGMPYTEFRSGERRAGGMIRSPEEWGEVPPNWLVYFAVGDLVQAVDKVRATGGNVGHGPFEVPGVGRIAIAADPQGAHLALIQIKRG